MRTISFSKVLHGPALLLSLSTYLGCASPVADALAPLDGGTVLFKRAATYVGGLASNANGSELFLAIDQDILTNAGGDWHRIATAPSIVKDIAVDGLGNILVELGASVLVYNRDADTITVRETLFAESDAPSTVFLTQISTSPEITRIAISDGRLGSFSSDGWRVEQVVQPRPPDRYLSHSIFAVASHGDSILIGGFTAWLRSSTSASWRYLELPRKCLLTAAAWPTAGAVIGGSDPPCLFQLSTTGLIDRSDEVSRFRDGIYRAASSTIPGAAALFSYAGDVVLWRADSNRPSQFRLAEFSTLRGMAIMGKSIVTIGERSDSALVVVYAR